MNNAITSNIDQTDAGTAREDGQGLIAIVVEPRTDCALLYRKKSPRTAL
jgi:hypothetical protein